MASTIDQFRSRVRGTEGSVPDGGKVTVDRPVMMAGHDYVGTKATIVTPVLGGNNQVAYTCLIPGAVGNAVTIEYEDLGAGFGTTLEINDLAIKVKGDISGVGITANQVIELINEDPVASRIFMASRPGATTGTGNIVVTAALNLAGGAGETLVHTLQVDGSGNIIVVFNDDIIGEPGVAMPTRGVAIGGTDGANFRHIRTDATGAVEVIQPTAADLNVTSTQPVAADLNCTEASAAAIEGHLDTLDDIVGTSDAAAPTDGAQIGGLAHSGNPAPMSADNDFVRSLHTLLGQLRVYMDSALNRVNDEVRAEDIPPAEITGGGKTACGAPVGTPVQLVAASTPCRCGVWLQIDPKTADPGAAAWITAGVHFTSAANSIMTGAGVTVAGRFFRRTANAEGNICQCVYVRVDDASKLYIDADGVCDVIWQSI